MDNTLKKLNAENPVWVIANEMYEEELRRREGVLMKNLEPFVVLMEDTDPTAIPEGNIRPDAGKNVYVTYVEQNPTSGPSEPIGIFNLDAHLVAKYVNTALEF